MESSELGRGRAKVKVGDVGNVGDRGLPEIQVFESGRRSTWQRLLN